MGVITHDAVSSFCQNFPDAVLEHPWGDTVFKVKQKIFVLVSNPDQALSVTVKVPLDLRELWLSSPHTYIPSYVGRFGWIGIHIVDENTWDMARMGISQSYEIVAAKTRKGKR